MSTTNRITPSRAHRGPGATASILTWFLTVTVILSVIARLGFRLSKLKLQARDDIALCIAALLHIAQCVAVSIEADAGLGQHRSVLTDAGLTRFLKANFAADVLFIPTFCMAQMSAFFLVESVPASQKVRNAVRYMNLANLTWSIVATLCVIFRSDVHKLWSIPASSINMSALWTVQCIIAIIVELVLMIVPFWIILPLQTTRAKRTAVLVTFSFRVFVIAAIAARLAITPSAASLEADMTRNLAEPVIASQAVLSCAIIMASIPVLSHFLDQFETGMLRVHGGQAVGYGSSSNPIESHRMSSLTTRTRVTANKKPCFGESVWEAAGEGISSQGTLEPIERNDDTRRARRGSKSSDTKGILISRSWDCQYEHSEGTSSEGERSTLPSEFR